MISSSRRPWPRRSDSTFGRRSTSRNSLSRSGEQQKQAMTLNADAAQCQTLRLEVEQLTARCTTLQQQVWQTSQLVGEDTGQLRMAVLERAAAADAAVRSPEGKNHGDGRDSRAVAGRRGRGGAGLARSDAALHGRDLRRAGRAGARGRARHVTPAATCRSGAAKSCCSPIPGKRRPFAPSARRCSSAPPTAPKRS